MAKTKLKRPNQRIQSFCDEFAVTRSYVHKQIREGRLKAFKLGKATILDGESVADLLQAGGYDFDRDIAD